MLQTKKILRTFAILAMLIAPAAFAVLPGVQSVLGQGSRAPNVIATTLAFINGQVVTVQYTNIYFCNSPGPATSSSSSPCVVGIDAVKDPVPDVASSILDVIVPAFFHPLCDILKVTCSSDSINTASADFNPALGANNFTQCPDNTQTLTCPNHPDFLDLTPTGIAGVIPLVIHSHILSGPNNNHTGQWWKLRVWLVLDESLWPNPSTGACSAGSGCLTSITALTSATSSQVVGPVATTIYLKFSIVSANAH